MTTTHIPPVAARPHREPDELPGETWRPVPGWGAAYEVSDRGRVRKPASEVPRRRGGTQHYRPLLLRTFFRNGTPMVQLLRPDGSHRARRVARLVADAFLPPQPRGMRLVFLDGDRAGVRADNLAWRVPGVGAPAAPARAKPASVR